jgi:hypothetical protein
MLNIMMQNNTTTKHLINKIMSIIGIIGIVLIVGVFIKVLIEQIKNK